MTSLSSTTLVLDSVAERELNPELPDGTSEDVGARPLPKSTYSSAQQAALTLVIRASEQAGAQAAIPYHEPHTLQEQLLDERRKTAIQRANAEQARRSAECARAAFQSLLDHLIQPCFALDDIGRIRHWNAALVECTGIPETDALGQPLANLFPLATAAQIEAGSMALRESAEYDETLEKDAAFVLNSRFSLGGRSEATRITLVPYFRIPGIVETVIALLEISCP